MTRLPTSRLVLLLGLTLAIGCAPGAEDAAPEVDEAPAVSEVMPSVTIVSPTEGSEIEGGTVEVRLESAGFEVAPAGTMDAGTGHHHLFLNRDVSAPNVPVPTEAGFIVHMGDGSVTHTFEDVAPGEHRLIAVVGDGLHVPLSPWVVDTVTFTVR